MKNPLNLSDLILSYLSKDFPKKCNKEILASIKELDEGHGTFCTSIDDFWEQMGINPELSYSTRIKK
ncbi:MAG: hypothetical protein C5B45_02675 [Chlamydiae bacterium]|nr:MAG: hypothetical protein C5B45_02675 [Chlamydiota bacterium]